MNGIDDDPDAARPATRPPTTPAERRIVQLLSALSGACFPGVPAWVMEFNVWLVVLIALAGAGWMLLVVHIISAREERRRVNSPQGAARNQAGVPNLRGEACADSDGEQPWWQQNSCFPTFTALGAGAGFFLPFALFPNSALRFVVVVIGLVAGGVAGFYLDRFLDRIISIGLSAGYRLLERCLGAPLAMAVSGGFLGSLIGMGIAHYWSASLSKGACAIGIPSAILSGLVGLKPSAKLQSKEEDTKPELPDGMRVRRRKDDQTN